MDITKMIIKKSHSTNEHKNSETNKREDKDSFNNVLNEHVKGSHEADKKKEIKSSIKEESSNEMVETEELKVNKIIESIEEIINEAVDNSEGDIASLIISLLGMMNKLTDGFEKTTSIPQNPDGTINIESTKNLIKDLLEKSHDINVNKNMKNSLFEMATAYDNLEKVSSEKDGVQSLEKLLDVMTKKPELIEKIDIKGFEGIAEKLKEVLANPDDKSKISSLKDDIKNILQSKLGLEEKNNPTIKENSNFGNDKNNKEKSSDSEIKLPKKEEKTEVVKEEKFLKNLISDESKGYDKFSINSFKNSFGRIEGVKSEPVITKGNAVFDMVKTVKFMQTNALKELTVKIYPKELGEITISISQDKDVMKANIKANTKDAYTLLNNNLVDIKKNLAEQNIKIQEVNISLYNDDTTFYREGQENRNSLFQEELKKGNGEVLIDEPIEEESIYDGNVNMLA